MAKANDYSMQIDKTKLRLQMAKSDNSLASMAEAMGLTRSALSLMLKRNNMQPQSVGKIAKALNCEVEDLL